MTAVNGPLILNDRELGISAALKGLGIAMWAEHRLRPYIDAGQLVPVLKDWSPRYPGSFAYYRRQRFMSSALPAQAARLPSSPVNMVDDLTRACAMACDLQRGIADHLRETRGRLAIWLEAQGLAVTN